MSWWDYASNGNYASLFEPLLIYSGKNFENRPDFMNNIVHI